ncbi:DUF499 domain-containing protein [Selenomonas sp. AB3002]|uniref:DUF499 domain-containing protein n=1 Tax=Selenomonas sp. AB3002 TaxID=1392502 RepID=UPI000496A955
MRTLFDLCKPRQSVFDENKRDDVLHLMNLIEKKIDPEDFFAENYLTDGMKELLTVAFQRFMGIGATGLVKLTQAMGGGKTHNMIALGLLSMYPSYRAEVLPEAGEYRKLGAVRVVAFNGRESDAKFGIWGAIAEQLGKKDVFRDYYSPLQAPGETAWVNLLQGEPLLILLDEIPPYLENAKATTVGNSDLSVVTATALSNLFSALSKDKLTNVCVVISDLEATYESGSELIRSSFKNLSNEVNRTSRDIEPVGSASDEVYHILRKRLFAELPVDEEVNEIAIAYQKAVLEAKQMGYTNEQPDRIYTGIKEAYPFHPAMRNLYARFKENPGFQQTRGLIRFMRRIVAGLYENDGERAKKKYLVHVYDFDLNNRGMLGEIQGIKSSLTQAIATDIASGGKAFAEEIDQQYQNTNASDAAKLILVASLADVPNALLGLDPKEVVGYLCSPDRDITLLKRAMDDFSMKSWYMQNDKKGHIFFQNTRNMIAEMQSLTGSYSNEDIKATTLRKFLQNCFQPKQGNCYQKLLIFPAVDEIQLSRDEVTLVVFEPHRGGLHPELQAFYEATNYKNRVMFLSGNRDTMERLYTSAKELKAIEQIISNIRAQGNVAEDNPQLQMAKDTQIKKKTAILSAARETFTLLHYPLKERLRDAAFMMEFRDNDYNGEEQVINTLLAKHKFSNDQVSEKVQGLCEKNIFTRKQMMISEIRERTATETSWLWYYPGMLDDLQEYCFERDLWRQDGEYIEKGPFPKEPTSLNVTMQSDEHETGPAHLKLRPQYGDRVLYDEGAQATESSLTVENLNDFVTEALEISFLCVDSTGEHPAGDPVKWQRPITIKHKINQLNTVYECTLESQKGVELRYTTDGSEPGENGGLYDGTFAMPDTCQHVLVAAMVKGEVRARDDIKVEQAAKKQGIVVKEASPLYLSKSVRYSSTRECYEELGYLKKYNIDVEDVNVVISIMENEGDGGYIELNIGGGSKVTAEVLENTINELRRTLATEKDVNISMGIEKKIFGTGRNFIDYNREKKIGIDTYSPGEIRQDD